VVADHGHTGARGADNGLGGLEQVDKADGSGDRFPLVAAVEGRLTAAGLGVGIDERDGQPIEESDHGLADFGIEGVHQTLDKEGNGCRGHGKIPGKMTGCLLYHACAGRTGEKPAAR
jgi:hypothetical protein